MYNSRDSKEGENKETTTSIGCSSDTETANGCENNCQVILGIKHIKVDRPDKWVLVEIPCPRSFLNECADKPNQWHCSLCNTAIMWDFGECFYCKCGAGSVGEYTYKCNDARHGNEYIKYSTESMQKSISHLNYAKDDINILVMGKTGVGKSTWINAIANYLHYDSVDEAVQKGMVCLIPSQFNVTDFDTKSTVVRIGDEETNESFQTGKSGTQFPRAYSLYVDGRLIRIIDTPGICDTRGVEEDKKNFENILEFISKYDKLNAICILLKPNDSKLTVIFRFCVQELLYHLHKSAAANLLFCYTNARSTFYKPGDTQPILQKLLDDTQRPIRLCRKNVFCLDNESFRFLAADRQGIHHDGEDVVSYKDSWIRSVRETARLFKTVYELNPHLIRDTTSLNKARNAVIQASTPLAELTRAMTVNLKRMEEHKEKIISCAGSISDFREKLYVPVTTYEKEDLDYPKTVCASPKCSSMVKCGNCFLRKYDQHCHAHCYLEGVKQNVMNNRRIQNCNVMEDGTCTICGCGWEEHMHIFYNLEEIETKVIDEEIKQMLGSKLSHKELEEAAIEKINREIEELKLEKKVFTHLCVKLALFLKEHAITPYNDAIKEYLGHMIREQRAYVAEGAPVKQLQYLEAALADYDEEVEILNKVMNMEHDESVCLTSEGVETTLKEIYNLPKCRRFMSQRASKKRVKHCSADDRCMTASKTRENKSGLMQNLSKMFRESRQFFRQNN